MNLVQTVAPVIEPVTLGQLKAHVRVTKNDEDQVLTDLIVAAREQAEIFTRRGFITQTFELTLDGFFDPRDPHIRDHHGLTFSSATIRIPRPPTIVVNSIKFLDTAGVLQTLASNQFQVDLGSEPARLRPAPTLTWPSTEAERINTVIINFDAGFGPAATDVSAPIRLAIKHWAAHWYWNREPVVIGTTAGSLPMHVESLLLSARWGDWP